MAARSKRPPSPGKAETCQASSTLVGPAFTLQDGAAATRARGDRTPIDFQALQDSISPTRRSPAPKLMPKVKRTTAKPSNARETKVKL